MFTIKKDRVSYWIAYGIDNRRFQNKCDIVEEPYSFSEHGMRVVWEWNSSP